MKLTKRELCETRDVTLDGRPAIICGALNDFATVRCQAYDVEFAWPTVEHIVTSRNAVFKS